MTDAARDRTPQLRHLMQQVNLPSFRALCQASGITEKQLRHLRHGNWVTLRLTTLQHVSQALQMSVADLITTFEEDEEGAVSPSRTDAVTNSPVPGLPSVTHPGQLPATDDPPELIALRQEYDRLQTQLSQQRAELWQEFQQSSVQILESLLLQLPTALYAAQQNPQAPAVKLIPLLRPIDHLLQQWEIVAIAPVGSEIPYDPQLHQLMDGTAETGDRVRVRYTGYRQGDKLLYRAKVSPVV
jgi:DNA-binding Xre family transcriptional regulator